MGPALKGVHMEGWVVHMRVFTASGFTLKIFQHESTRPKNLSTLIGRSRAVIRRSADQSVFIEKAQGDNNGGTYTC